MPPAQELTRHHPLPRRYFARDILSGKAVSGYTGRDLFKFFGLITVLLFLLAYTYTRYFELFDGIHAKPAGFKLFVLLFSGLPLLLVLVAALGFFWWASGALVRHSRWQLSQARLWRWFWMAVLLFYAYVELDPLDRIHPAMSRQGLAPAPNLLELYDGKFTLFQFQWGYFLLWALFWFLVAVLHYSYVLDGLKELWFYIKRINRYGASVLTGFRETAAVYGSAPVTLMYPHEPAQLPESYSGVPYLNAARLTAEQAAGIQAAGPPGAFAAVPGQPEVLFVDLGVYAYSPDLAALTDAAGMPLLAFEPRWQLPDTAREGLVVPLSRPQAREAL
jgi:hypothetical protein